MTPLRLIAALLALAAPAHAQDVLTEYWTNSGSLPPEYAWDTTVTIRSDGQLILKHCRGYETEGPACKTRRARLTEADLAAIRAAAAESGLAEKPATKTDTPTVGGSLTGGVVHLDGTRIDLLTDPAEADVARVAAVLAVIAATIPPRFDRFLDAD